MEMRDAGRAGAVEQIDLHRQRVQEVGQRQPDRADLLPSRRDAVEDSTRDDEVSARVVVAEREAQLVIVQSRGRADDRRGDRRQNAATPIAPPRGRYNHLFILMGRFVDRLRALALVWWRAGVVRRRVPGFVVPAAPRHHRSSC